MTSLEPNLLPNGTVIQAYTINKALGRGYFSIRYRAQNELGQHFTLIEHCPSDQVRRHGTELVPIPAAASDYTSSLDQFVEQSLTLLPLQHPSLCSLKDFVRANQTAYQVWEDFTGETLEASVPALGRPLTQEEVDRIAFPVLEAIATLHDHRRLHLELSPRTVARRRNDGRPIVYGLGQAATDWTGITHYNPCAPPELYAGNPARMGPWSDVYAISATLYWACSSVQHDDAPTRQLSDTLQPLHTHVQAKFRPGFLKAIDRGLTLQPAKRPQSVAELAEALRT